MTVNNVPGYAFLEDYMGNDRSIVRAARSSIGGQTPSTPDGPFIKKLWDSEHTTPFEHTALTFHLECAIFTGRQIMRHRTFSFSEISSRYTQLKGEYYLPSKLYEQKPGDEPKYMKNELVSMEAMVTASDAVYNALILQGVSREQARMVLPMSAFTEFYMTGNLLNWIKFLKLRHTDHAQYEVWYVASQIMTEIKNLFPLVWEAIKEDVGGTERQLAESRHTHRFIQERGFRDPSGESPRNAPTYSSQVPDPLQLQTGNRPAQRPSTVE